MTYDEAENLPATHVRLAQWARAEAAKALLSAQRAADLTRGELDDEINALAHLIIEGNLPSEYDPADDGASPDCPHCIVGGIACDAHAAR